MKPSTTVSVGIQGKAVVTILPHAVAIASSLLVLATLLKGFNLSKEGIKASC